jgi:hypothetical protein
MTLEEFMKHHLRYSGHDGLCLPDQECGCTLADFMPCGEPSPECRPAKDEGPKNDTDHWMVPSERSQ